MRWLLLAIVVASCGAKPSADVSFPAMDSIAQPSGRGSFRFGVSTAATQIEDQDTHTDWYVWTSPLPEGRGKDTFVGDAAGGYTRAIDDIALLQQLHVDSYRLGIEWARIEPVRGQINEEALTHYRQVLEALVAKGIRPMVTVHHFANPVWVDNPNDVDCHNGPSDTNLCGWADPVGGPQILASMKAHAKLLGQRFGDLVDEWCSLNEPTIYLLGAYGMGVFPPGKSSLFNFFDQFIPVAHAYLSAHVAIYDGLKEGDTVDADHDGVAASVGFTTSVSDWVPSHNGLASSDPADVAAKDHALFVYEYSFVDSMLQGGWSTKADGVFDEPRPDWKGKLDWLGLQYYTRAGVSSVQPGEALIAGLDFQPCQFGFDLGSCIPPLDPSFRVAVMDYEYSPEGLYNVLHRYQQRFPTLPFTVTESGIATENPTRRAEVLVRALEQISRARGEGADVRGMYHWSLMDNLEWHRGFVPRFGLFHVNFETFERTPTKASQIYGDIAAARKVTAAQRRTYGGIGPLSPEP